jgi:hypothetical protein
MDRGSTAGVSFVVRVQRRLRLLVTHLIFWATLRLYLLAIPGERLEYPYCCNNVFLQAVYFVLAERCGMSALAARLCEYGFLARRRRLLHISSVL